MFVRKKQVQNSAANLDVDEDEWLHRPMLKILAPIEVTAMGRTRNDRSDLDTWLKRALSLWNGVSTDVKDLNTMA